MVSLANAHVDILLSTYNGADWLPELLASIRSQTHEQWTLRIRDDGSSDETAAVLRNAAASDPRIELVDDGIGNLGPSASFMTLLNTVTAPYFAFCDQDDIWLNDKLERSLAALSDAELAAVYTDATITDETGRLERGSAMAERGLPEDGQVGFGKLLINNAAIGATVLATNAVARSAVDLAAGRPVLMHDWWVALVSSYAGSLRGVTEPTIKWRRHAKTVTGSRPAGIRGRALRRREYLAWSIEAASWLAAGAGDATAERQRSAAALSSMRETGPTVRGVHRAARQGVRAWTPSAQLGLLFSVGIRRLGG